MALKFAKVAAVVRVQTITKLYPQFKFPYASNLNILGTHFSSCSTNKDGNGGKDPTSKSSRDDKKRTAPPKPSLYDSRKISADLPSNDVCPSFESLLNIPTGVFRNTQGEILGRGVAKCYSFHMNPEYYSYHNMSFYDFHLYLRQYRKVSPDTARKPPY